MTFVVREKLALPFGVKPDMIDSDRLIAIVLRFLRLSILTERRGWIAFLDLPLGFFADHKPRRRNPLRDFGKALVLPHLPRLVVVIITIQKQCATKFLLQRAKLRYRMTQQSWSFNYIGTPIFNAIDNVAG